jgi:hypothetical protein
MRFSAHCLMTLTSTIPLPAGNIQEHLNNVFGARLRITSLRASAGPGIEFLEYLSPRDGRPIPSDEKANDMIH